jgi:ABC-2 type transport system ATP-binding protein
MPQITVQDLSKTYRVAERRRGLVGLWRGLFYRTHREIEALKGVSFSLDRGELVGIIGPNGAGKSTLIKILCGILMPSSGACEIDGRVPWTDRIRHVARIGVVFGQRSQLWWDLPVIDSTTCFAISTVCRKLGFAQPQRTSSPFCESSNYFINQSASSRWDNECGVT